MDKTEKIWLDGKLINWEDAKVHVLAHALNYGTGLFEGIRVYQTPKGPAVFRLKDHVRRLVDGCKIMGLDLEFGGKTYTQKDIEESIKDTIRANENVDYVKPCIFLSGEEVGLNPVGVSTSMAITCIHMGTYLGKAGSGAKVIVSSWQRPDNLCGPVGAKVNGAYVASCLAKREAVRQGANEAVMLNSVGRVAECTGENIFIYRHGKIYTPSTGESILEGITRDSIIQVARNFGYEVIETEVTRFQLVSADEVWMTGTAAEVVPVTTVDGKMIGDGKAGEIAQKIHSKFHDIVEGKAPEYNKWLDYVN
ncbi:MAG: branched-chain amino acid transaminase [Candidatus Methanomethylophilaceae archaeon]|nr:branched-chain amino acid transaminase [Candidatus Cloacimonadota bacterium]MDD3378772.1 branched-chain amino acid transaminase [Candidatus Methanomethylophilaceae archaeon]MDY0224390.1 branched-chain amino acid transaminase [Candidatus Methanomethylophilaceae archaeon]